VEKQQQKYGIISDYQFKQSLVTIMLIHILVARINWLKRWLKKIIQWYSVFAGRKQTNLLMNVYMVPEMITMFQILIRI
jgi:hypothetical protein